MEIPPVNAPIAGSPAPPPPVDDDRRVLIHAVRAINQAELYGQEHELSFAVDRVSRRAVVRIVDRKTRDVVDQIPSEQVLRLAEELKQQS